MATYIELRQLFGNGDLLNRVEVGCIVAAHAIYAEAPETANHANRLVWAVQTMTQPRFAAEKMLMSLLAANKTAAVGTISGASDATIQSAVDAAINLFATG